MLDKNKLIENNIDYEMGIKRFAGKESLYEKYFLKFPDDENFNLGKSAYKNGNNAKLLEAFHALKGITGILGMTDLYNSSDDIIQSIRNNELDNIDELFNKATDIYDKYYKLAKDMK